MVICTKCKQSKDWCMFSSNKRKVNLLESHCKECVNIARIKYTRTEKWLIKKIYASQKSHSKNRWHNPPEYSYDELFTWITLKDNFNILFKKWVDSDYNKNNTPSIDRLNDYKCYSLDNIQLTTWKENYTKGYNDRKSWKNNKVNKAVLQYSSSMVLLQEFHSIRWAERETWISNGNISNCCKMRIKTAGGFIWKYNLK